MVWVGDTDKPYRVKAAGRTWWYKAEAVRLADGATVGQWRDQRVTAKYCSLPGDAEGPLCDHGPVIRTDHWSCCGSGSQQVACTKVRSLQHRCDRYTVRGLQHHSYARVWSTCHVGRVPHGAELVVSALQWCVHDGWCVFLCVLEVAGWHPSLPWEWVRSRQVLLRPRHRRGSVARQRWQVRTQQWASVPRVCGTPSQLGEL